MPTSPGFRDCAGRIRCAERPGGERPAGRGGPHRVIPPADRHFTLDPACGPVDSTSSAALWPGSAVDRGVTAALDPVRAARSPARLDWPEHDRAAALLPDRVSPPASSHRRTRRCTGFSPRQRCNCRESRTTAAGGAGARSAPPSRGARRVTIASTSPPPWPIHVDLPGRAEFVERQSDRRVADPGQRRPDVGDAERPRCVVRWGGERTRRGDWQRRPGYSGRDPSPRRRASRRPPPARIRTPDSDRKTIAQRHTFRVQRRTAPSRRRIIAPLLSPGLCHSTSSQPLLGGAGKVRSMLSPAAISSLLSVATGRGVPAAGSAGAVRSSGAVHTTSPGQAPVLLQCAARRRLRVRPCGSCRRPAGAV